MAGNATLRRIALYSAAIVSGTLIPSFVRFAVPSQGDGMDAAAFRAAFSPSSENFTLWGLHALPLIILTYIVLYSLPQARAAECRQLPSTAGAFGAYSLQLGFLLLLNIELQSAPSRSTDSIAYFFLPVSGLLVACIGYVIGWTAGRLFARVRAES